MSATAIFAKSATKGNVPIRCDDDGTLRVDVVAGGGGSSSVDLTTTNALITSANADLALLDTAVGNPTDTTASSDTGTFSLVALWKRALTTLTTIAGNFAALATSSNQTNGNQTSKIVNGANTLSVDASGAVTVNNSAPSSLSSYTNTGAVSVNTILVASIDCTLYRQFNLNCTSFAGGSVQVQISNDNSNWVPAIWTGINTNQASSTIAGAIMVNGSTSGARYLRVIQSSASVSGTMTFTLLLSQQPYTTSQPGISGLVSVSGAYPAMGVALNPVANVGGFTTFHTLIAASSTNSTSVKASNGTIGICLLTNNSASVRYVKFFNKSSAPTVGTDTPVIQYPIQPNSSLNISMTGAGMRFSSGIAYCITTGSALLDNTAVTAGDVLVNLTYV